MTSPNNVRERKLRRPSSLVIGWSYSVSYFGACGGLYIAGMSDTSENGHVSHESQSIRQWYKG
jgi:hypothetical protein